MLPTIAEIGSLIEAILKFARDEVVSEFLRPTALLQSIVDDVRKTFGSIRPFRQSHRFQLSEPLQGHPRRSHVASV
jgi:hypothetical protein